MSNHILINGTEFIARLEILGKILGYHVELELHINGAGKAVDVAWFRESNQKFPLFIFEVESNVTNAAVYNPLKVFAEKNESFEKPLFFFQVFLKRGQESSKIVDLRNQFGSFNYRIYRMSTKERHAFIIDVLSQHRRISSDLEISRLFDFLITTQWLSVSLADLATHIEALEFERTSGKLLPSYLYLSSIHKELIPIGVNYLTKIHRDYYSGDYAIEYGTYLGNTWHYPIHLGIIFSGTSDLQLKNKMFQQLKEWQANKEYLSMVGPHFGLSRDYDEFVIWGAGGLFALLAGLFKGYQKVILYLVDELKKIIEGSRDEFKIPNLLWLIHMLSGLDNGDTIYQNYILPIFKNLKAFSIHQLMLPPFLDTDRSFLDSFLSCTDEIPSLLDIQNIFASISKNDSSSIQTACKCLTTIEQDGHNYEIVRLLYSNKTEM